jgi:hypothetical protein
MKTSQDTRFLAKNQDESVLAQVLFFNRPGGLTGIPKNDWGVLKKSVTEIVNVGDQADVVCLRSQQATSR